MSIRMLKLNNETEIPVIGLGTYNSVGGEIARVVRDAIEAGYRHIDCAWYYGNEAEIGAALKQAFADGLVKRKDLYITTKLWNNFHEKKLVVPKLKESLTNLGLDYVDLFLIHWPMGFKENANLLPKNDPSSYSDVDYLETWEGMEECVNLGLTKSIGVSNFNEEQLERVLKACKIKPVVNQIEVNPNLNQENFIAFCKARNVEVVAFSPLGRGANSTELGHPQSSLTDPKIGEIAKKHNKTPGQVILRFLVGLDVAILPKSATKSRIIDNIRIFDFDLDQEDINYLKSCNREVRVAAAADFKTHKYFPF